MFLSYNHCLMWHMFSHCSAAVIVSSTLTLLICLHRYCLFLYKRSLPDSKSNTSEQRFSTSAISTAWKWIQKYTKKQLQTSSFEIFGQQCSNVDVTVSGLHMNTHYVMLLTDNQSTDFNYCEIRLFTWSISVSILRMTELSYFTYTQTAQWSHCYRWTS